jgi:hypothetical protein
VKITALYPNISCIIKILIFSLNSSHNKNANQAHNITQSATQHYNKGSNDMALRERKRMNLGASGGEKFGV